MIHCLWNFLADWKWFLNAVVVNKATYTFIPNKLSVYECGGISEDENWREDLVRLRDEFYPNYISEIDMRFMRELRVILKYRWSRVCYRIIKSLVKKYERYRQNKSFNYIRFKING